MTAHYVIYDSTTRRMLRSGSCQDGDVGSQAGAGEAVLQTTDFYAPETIAITPGSPDTYQIGSSGVAIAAAVVVGISAETPVSLPALGYDDWSLAISPSSGAGFAVDTVTRKFVKIGNLVFFHLKFRIATVGSAVNPLFWTIPYPASADVALAGFDNIGLIECVIGVAGPNQMVASVSLVVGNVMNISGCYLTP